MDVDHTELELNDIDHSKLQQWNLSKTSDGYKNESAVKNKYCLAISDLKKGAGVSLEKADDSDKQSWNLSNISSYTGSVFSRASGTIEGPSGKETYYNLDMSEVVDAMKERGIDRKYWVRNDGVKMYGKYVMAAADLEIRPYGTLVETSLGMGMVIDTGRFASSDSTQLDIAVNW